MKYKRIILKLSGEALLSQGVKKGICLDAAAKISSEIKTALDLGVQIGIVIGGGNIFRGAVAAAEGGICQAQADRMGMLATVINGIGLQEAMLQNGIDTVLMSALSIQGIAHPFDRRSAIRDMQEGRVLIFCGGTGSPFFSTDTAASLRALEVDAEAILKGTKVDGVYSADPKKDPQAKRFDKLSYIDVLKNQLKVMDSTAVSMCMDHNIPIVVFDVFKAGNMKKVVSGEKLGTVVYG
ncbi:MAG: UMP kinase [Deltaproteobacteria bacterium]|jgi:uridylate kinase|nr:UMP kinase [Deltaproteobacteria bacterium]